MHQVANSTEDGLSGSTGATPGNRAGPASGGPAGAPPPDETAPPRAGLLYGIGAYGLWGLIPLYFKALGGVSPPEILAHRVVWSCLLMIVVVAIGRRMGELTRALRSKSVMITLLTTTLLIGFNWLVYIYAVDTNQVLQASLGYFITPLANVLLGVVVLRERLRGPHLAAIGLALVGVMYLTIASGKAPWIAMTLAVTFALYGLLRKLASVDGLLALTVETLLLLPVSVGYLALLEWNGDASWGGATTQVRWLLVASGVITAVPLLMFAAAARRLRMATMGILQYIAPTVQFLLAVQIFGEPFTGAQQLSFACIWLAVALYAGASIFEHHRSRRRQAETLSTECSDLP